MFSHTKLKIKHSICYMGRYQLTIPKLGATIVAFLSHSMTRNVSSSTIVISNLAPTPAVPDFIHSASCADPEGDMGSRPPPEKSQKYRISSNTGPDPLKNHKATKPAFNVGLSLARHQNAI